tara:strand:+ start:86 stop:400 length:315 start_codon:yes stop_codon:yes gene_type:complete
MHPTHNRQSTGSSPVGPTKLGLIIMHTIISNNKRKARKGKTMSNKNVVKFPEKEKVSKVDKQFLELEHQADQIARQQKRIDDLMAQGNIGTYGNQFTGPDFDIY